MPPSKFAVDYNLIRKALVGQVEAMCQTTCMMEEPETQNSPRPPKPYMSMKIMNAGMKTSDDDILMQPGGVQVVAGQRKMMVDFNSYGRSHEEAYNYMALWQTALESDCVEQELRQAGIAVWTVGNVADLSQLLNTGYEGRAHLECSFGIAVNLSMNIGTIEKATVEVQVDGTDILDLTIP